MDRKILTAVIVSTLMLSACKTNTLDVSSGNSQSTPAGVIDNYAEFTLTSNLSHLSSNQKKMLPILIEIATIMDELFWLQTYGEKNKLLRSIESPSLQRLVEINYGPWDRMEGDKAIIAKYGEKALGANFYPKDMSKEEFESSTDKYKTSPYTILKRDVTGKLFSQFYHDTYPHLLSKASNLLLQAAELADDNGFKHYLTLRAKALMDDNFTASDFAWMEMKNNDIDFIVGPIESYEDLLYENKKAYAAFVIIKDKTWNKKLARLSKLLPQLQEELPVPTEYKTETPGSDSELNAYDAIYYAGHGNAGGKTIAINLPNDEVVQLKRGTRRLQLKNAMQAKFEKIMAPITDILIAPEQRKHVTFSAFFSNTMFHEVAHGLGIRKTVNNKGSVRNALKNLSLTQEEGKADALGLFIIEKLFAMGELSEGEIMDHYVTSMAGIFRSARFGSSSSHGIANMLRFNYFAEQQAFNYNEKTGYYSVNPDKMSTAIRKLASKILISQGDGDYAGVKKWIEDQGKVSPQLNVALNRLKNIPVDIVFNQGVQYLQGL